jgi:hypothetical protein
MAYSKIQPDDWREGLKDAKRLFILKKKRSPRTIEFIEDPKDPWFIFIVGVGNKSKKFESCSIITAKNIEEWIDVYKRQGWEIITANTIHM